MLPLIRSRAASAMSPMRPPVELAARAWRGDASAASEGRADPLRLHERLADQSAGAHGFPPRRGSARIGPFPSRMASDLRPSTAVHRMATLLAAASAEALQKSNRFRVGPRHAANSCGTL
jgi:hypothetical protein